MTQPTSEGAGEKFQGERYLLSWRELLERGDNTVEYIFELWMVASQSLYGKAPWSEWQRLWWMFRRYRGVLQLIDFDEYEDRRADAATVHRYIAKAYQESLNKLHEYPDDWKASIVESYRRVIEALEQGWAPPRSRTKKKIEGRCEARFCGSIPVLAS